MVMQHLQQLNNKQPNKSASPGVSTSSTGGANTVDEEVYD